MSLISDNSCILEVLGVEVIIEIKIKRRYISNNSLMNSIVIIPLPSIIDNPDNKPKDENQAQFTQLVKHKI